MRKIFTKLMALSLLFTAVTLQAQQLPDPHFEDWSDSFNGDAQPKSWHGSNVEQVGFKFTFLYQKEGRTGYCAYVADKEVGALGITEVGPGYFGLGTSWQKLEGINTSSATAGTYGGISFKYRPDSMVVWIKRTGDNATSEDFHLLFYSWTGTASGTDYKNKAGKCTSVSMTDEESDIRIALDGNECTTTTPGTQIAEGWYRARAKYNNWTRVSVPIYYMSDATPSKCNVIFSAGNYPNFRANSGLYAGNGLYVDDVELIYSNKIQKIYFDNVAWNGFDPNSSEEQVYSLGSDATEIPNIVAKRGVGSLTNTKSKTVAFAGRSLTSSEMTINKGKVGEVTTITVKDINGNSRVYKIRFVKEASKNTKLAGISVNGEAIANFSPNTFDYTYELPYGTKNAPVVTVEKQEDGQTVEITQAASVTGKATVKVTAANPSFTTAYTITFKVAQLKDNTLKDILINGESLPGFVPSQTIYKVALPLTTTTVPEITPVSAYEAGAQTIVVNKPGQVDGGKATIEVTTPGNPVPKVYTLNFKLEASSYTKLKALHMMAPVDPTDPESNIIDYIENFNPDNQTYYVILPMGTSELPEVTYEVGEQSQNVTIQYGGLDGTTNVIVKAGNGAQMAYSILVSTLKSDVATLNNIIVEGNGELNPAFSPNIFKYTYSLEDRSQGLPTITWEPGDKFQTVEIVKGDLNETTRINVTAGDGSTKTYQIFIEVAKSNISYLNSIKVGGKEIAGWNKDVLEYTVTLEKDEAFPVVEYVKAEDVQIVNERRISAAPGDYKLTVIAENGEKRTYTIHFRLNLSDDATLAGMKLNGAEWDEFSPTKYEYTLILPPGSATPKFEAISRSGQTVVPSKANGVYTYAVTAEDKISYQEYKITVIIQKSENAYLDSITVNGKLIEGWNKEKLEYTYVYDGVLPTVLAYKANEAQQVSMTMPVGAGTATIVVVPDANSDESNVYKIDFKKASDASLYLDAIYVDGKLISGWNAETTEYAVTYTQDMPVITFDSKEGQNVTKLENNNKVVLIVDIDGETTQYVINLTKKVSDNALLAGLYLDGTLIANWNANVHDYTKELGAGEKEPVITWQKAEKEQTVIFGQQDAGVYQIVVLSASKGNTATYTVTMETQKYNDATLTDIMLDGVSIIDGFVDDKYDGGSVSDGAILPTVTYVKKEGQNVLLSDVSATQQRILVVAESGAKKEYIINYTLTNGDDVQLSGILVDGVAIKGFDPAVSEYTVKLDERTAQVPAITPQSNIVGQTYIITYGRVNENTTIKVISKDKSQTGLYTVKFEVRPLTNTGLAELKVVNDIYDETLDANKLEHTFVYDPSAGLPTVQYTAAEPEQRVEYTRLRGGDTEIKVIAQSGQYQTYKIHFTTVKPAVDNVLKSLTVNGDVKDLTAGDVINITLPFGTTTLPIEYEKNFDEQTVIVYNGGVTKPTKLIVCANHPDVADKVYTINPTVEPYAKAGKLESLTFKNTPVPNFQPNVYNYVVNVTAEPSVGDFVGTAFGGATVTKSGIDAKNKKITLTVAGGEVYTVSWFYENDGKYLKNGQYYDYLDFSQDWVATPSVPMWKATWTSGAAATSTKKSTGFKPYGWTVPADLVAGFEYDISLFGQHVVDLFWNSGKEVIAAGTNGAMLSTINGASINGSVPGMMTIGGTMTLKPDKKGDSSSGISYSENNFISFRNTPDSLSMSYKSLSASNISGWSYEIKTVVGGTTRTNTFGGNYNVSTWRYASLPITTYNGAMTKYAITINSAHTTNAGDMGGSNTIYTSDLQIENVHFVYNSIITSAKINGKDATVNNANKTISVTLDQEDVVADPQITVVGQVSDQEQVMTWGEEKLVGDNMVRTGTLRNYGEDHSYTDYAVTVTRPAVTIATLKSVKWGSETVTFVNNKYELEKLAPIVAMPATVTIEPNSVHQDVAVSHRNDSVIIVVTPEKGEAQTYVICYKESATTDATISLTTSSTLTPAFNADEENYTVVTMPQDLKIINRDLYQTVVMKYDADTTRIYVTAADKTTQKVYTIAKETPNTSANLTKFELDGTAKTVAAGTALEVDLMPKVVTFARQDASDAVVETIYSDSIVWNVTGTTKTNKYIIANKNEADHNAFLAGVLVDGKPYDEFNQTTFDNTIYTDSMVDLQFIAANQSQEITMSLKTGSSNSARRRAVASIPAVTFEITVKAKDGNTQTYTYKLEAPKGNDALLKGIVIGNDTIKEFYAEKTSYTYELPAASPKVNQPEIPAITYITSDQMATVDVEPAGVGEANAITVHSADGNVHKMYDLTIVPQKSSYAELNGIMVDGVLVPGFAPNRYYYSVQVEPLEQHSLEISSLDKFIDTTIVRSGKTAIINVTAEDGLHSQRYFVEMYEVSKSNNATLADLQVFDVATNSWKSIPEFDPMNNKYTIELAASDNMPDVQAVPMVNGQTITPKKEGSSVKIDVVAPDGSAENTYTVIFDKPLSGNAYLEYIQLDGVKIADFDPTNFVYLYNMPIGETVLPTIFAEAQENLEGQKEPDWSNVDPVKMRAEIISYAQNGDSLVYTILFNETKSSADTLLAIRYDNKLIDNFAPRTYFYEVPIASGQSFPDVIEYDQADDYQNVTLNLLSADEQAQLYQIVVKAQNGQMQTYTVNFVRQLLNVTTINMIKINGVPLAGFDVDVYDYSYILAANVTTMPRVEVETEESYKQKIEMLPAVDSIATKSLNQKMVITVTAENGEYKIYTIHFPIEVSKNATLNQIFYGGNALPSFVSTVYNYTVELPIGTTNVPQITYLKKEDAQNVDQSYDPDNSWKVYVDVTAEDKQYTQRYTINFVLAKSNNTLLKDIVFEDSLNLITFVPDIVDYEFEVPYSADRDTAHHMFIEPVASEEGQTIMVDSARYGERFQVVITVTAPNDDDMIQYNLVYSYRRNPDATLKNLWLDGDSIDGFMSDTLEYYVEFEVGTDSTQYYTPNDVTFVTSDPLANVSVKTDQSYTLYVVVTAQDTTSTRTYVIHQTTMLSGDNYLADMIIDGVSYRDFNPETLDYTYYVPTGSTAAPTVEAVPNDPRATVSIMPNGIDSVTIVTCVAENGKKRTYTILFTNSDIDDNISPKPTDVIVKRLYGTNKILVASLRKKVAFGLYDHAGRLVRYVDGIEPADPNDAIIAVDANGQETLVDVASEKSGEVIELNNNEIYFYVFFEAGTKRVCSGKLIIMN